jgi:hypothetical protein
LDGLPGVKGEPGFIGPPGLSGLRGDKGFPGRNGLDGQKGDIGPQGWFITMIYILTTTHCGLHDPHVRQG